MNNSQLHDVHHKTISGERTGCKHLTERSHSNILSVIQSILSHSFVEWSVIGPCTIEFPPLHCVPVVSWYPAPKAGKNKDIFDTDYIAAMRNLLITGGASDVECPEHVLLDSLEAHCETVSMSLAYHFKDALGTRPPKSILSAKSFLASEHRRFVKVLEKSNTKEQVNLLMQHEAYRLQDAHLNGTGWDSKLHQETMWNLKELFVDDGGALQDINFGCGIQFQRNFLLGSTIFADTVQKVASYVVKHAKCIVLPCYVLMYVFDGSALTLLQLAAKSSFQEHSACYSCHCIALLLDGKNKMLYMVDGNDSIIPGIPLTQLHLSFVL